MKRIFFDLLWDKNFEYLFSVLLNVALVLLAVLFGFWLYDGQNFSPRLDPMIGGCFSFGFFGAVGSLALYVLRIIFRKHKPEE